MAAWDMRLINSVGVPTCVRPQGSSSVDLTWVSPGLVSRVDGWVVRVDLESLSDHLYIDFRLRVGSDRGKLVTMQRNLSKRWNIKKMDRELFETALEFISGAVDSESVTRTPENYAEWLVRVLRDALEVSTPAVGTAQGRRKVYW